jgi:hypothetical protein
MGSREAAAGLTPCCGSEQPSAASGLSAQRRCTCDAPTTLPVPLGIGRDGVVHPRIVGNGPTLFAGLPEHVDLRFVDRVELASEAVAMRYEATR